MVEDWLRDSGQEEVLTGRQSSDGESGRSASCVDIGRLNPKGFLEDSQDTNLWEGTRVKSVGPVLEELRSHIRNQGRGSVIENGVQGQLRPSVRLPDARQPGLKDTELLVLSSFFKICKFLNNSFNVIFERECKRGSV